MNWKKRSAFSNCAKKEFAFYNLKDNADWACRKTDPTISASNTSAKTTGRSGASNNNTNASNFNHSSSAGNKLYRARNSASIPKVIRTVWLVGLPLRPLPAIVLQVIPEEQIEDGHANRSKSFT